jgi:hypothetical protein
VRVRGLPAFAVKAIQCMFAFPFKDFKLSVFARSVELGARVLPQPALQNWLALHPFAAFSVLPLLDRMIQNLAEFQHH